MFRLVVVRLHSHLTLGKDHIPLHLPTPPGVPKPPTVNPCQDADAIVLVYDLGRMETHARLTSYWLPLIQSIVGEGAEGRRWPKPLVLAANKVRQHP